MTVYYRHEDWTVEEVRPIDCLAVSLGLREADRREIFASSGEQGAAHAAAESVRGSLVCFCVKRRGSPVMLFGVARRALLGCEYVVWALASEEIERAPFAFLRHCRRAVERLNEVFLVMVNFVGVWNEQSLRWLRWCGFRVLPARRVGLHGEWFYPVVRRRG